ncbi:MAG: hypothetical protein H6742_10935 [Alphaproteobacteria bacterium]|nr:hypothetical protein [Alphaproteobacteria bacterium]
MSASGVYPAVGADQEATGLQEAVTGLHQAITGLHMAITGLHRAVSGAFPSLGGRGDDLSDLIQDALSAAELADEPPEIAEDFDVLSAITMELDPRRAADQRQAQQLFAAGRTAIGSGDLESAADAFSRAVALAPEDARYAEALDRVRGQLRRQSRQAARHQPATPVAGAPARPRARWGLRLGMASAVVAGCAALWFLQPSSGDAGAEWQGPDLAASHASVAPFHTLHRSQDGHWRGVLYGAVNGAGSEMRQLCSEYAWKLKAQPGDQLVMSWLGGGAVQCTVPKG